MVSCENPPRAVFLEARSAEEAAAYRIAVLVLSPKSADRIKWTLPPNENANAGRVLLFARRPVADRRRNRLRSFRQPRAATLPDDLARLGVVKEVNQIAVA